MPDTDALYAFVIDRLTERPEVADVNTSVVYEHIRRPVLEPLDHEVVLLLALAADDPSSGRHATRTEAPLLA